MNSIYTAFILSEYSKGERNSANIARKLNEKYGSNISRHAVYRYMKKIKTDISCKNVNQITIDEQEFTSCNKTPEPEEPKKKQIILQNQDPEVFPSFWGGTKKIKFGLISDTHIGSKYWQPSALYTFYAICASENVDQILHAGDLTDGLKMRPGHEYEVYISSADELVDHVIKFYPKCANGAPTRFITGNHDASIYKHIGYDIGRAISEKRDDMEYLGRDCAIVELTPNCRIELRHPWDGYAYAISYKPQKAIEAMEADSKPNILAIAHYHKAEYLFHRNVHCFQTACYQGQTPFTRGKNLFIHMGGWIIEADIASDGTIVSIQPRFVPVYKTIPNDYKNLQ